MIQIVKNFILHITPWRCTFLFKFLLSGLVSENKFVNEISESLILKTLKNFPE